MIKLNSKMMKNNFLLGLAIAATVFTSCGDEDVAGVTINDNSVVNNTTNNTTTQGGTTGETQGQEISIAGNYAEDLTLKAINTYNLIGPLVMKAGTTLNIEAGTVIKAQKGEQVYIAISQGAKIEAKGSAAKPIVMTSAAASPAPGDWGGLILLGKAPLNSSADLTATSESEIANLPYGGNLPSDNSGTLRYVRVEYSGGIVDADTENNAITFYGVGNGTTVEYIQAYYGKDDGVEFFGGTVNASYVSAVGNQDDSVDFTQGYAGTITDVYVKHDAAKYDKAFEIDGYYDKTGNLSNPKFWTNFVVKNVTIEGADGAGEAVRLRRGTQGTFENVIIRNFKEGFDIDGNDADNPTASHVTNGTLKATNIKFDNVTTKVKKEDGVTYTDADFLTEGEATGTDYATWGAGWTK